MSGLVAEAVAPAPAAAVAAPPPAVALAAAAAPVAHAAAPAAYDAAAAAAAAHGLGVQDLTWPDLFDLKLSGFNPFNAGHASTGITGPYIDNMYDNEDIHKLYRSLPLESSNLKMLVDT